jgi:two-component system, OmpR family, sensor kinase
MSRLPIRLRLALVFALAMAVVLAAFGTFVYLRLGASLDEQLDDRLQARAAAISTLAAGGDLPNAERLLGGDDDFAQVLGVDGSVVAGAPGLESTSLLSPAERAQARTSTLVVDRNVERGDGAEESRLLAARADAQGRPVIVVVGESLEERNEALAGLLAALLIGGPIALLLASLAGYLLAGAALRPVEAMRRRAAEISPETARARLPLPEARDEIFRLGETLNAMLARLDEGVARERRFVADASHELRTPLAALQTELELALRRPRSPAQLEQALRSAREEVERLVRLSEDLLVLAAAEEGRLPLRRSRFAGSDLLATVAGRFATRASAGGRAIEVAAASNGTVDGDRLRLEQALGNLVDNALRYGAGRVTLEAQAENGTLALRVSDEGAGFPPEFLPRAFERFSRADGARTRGGAGLGLALVDAVARAHGGTASACNRAGGGAEVTVTIPAQD